MSSDELSVWIREVESLKSLALALSERLESVEGRDSSVRMELEGFRTRVEALEKRFSAMEARMTHIDTILTELQGEVRRMARSIETTSREQAATLNAQTVILVNLEKMMERILDANQPKVTLGQG